MKRVFLIVLDSAGIGEAPDAEKFGDAGTHTFKAISTSPYFKINNLKKAGIGNIEGQDFLGKEEKPYAAVARLQERSMGKDTTIGHWEIAGVYSPEPLPTYPNGFPKEVLDEFSKATGRGVLCNLPYSGTEVINDYGDEHVKTGSLIVYTSADSVFQIAAHESIVPCETLYEYCRMARKILTGKHAVGRVIARPFIGESGNYKRTANRHDFSLEPRSKTVLDSIKDSGKDVIAVGKITDIFAGVGITKTIFTHGNTEGMAVTSDIQKEDFNGLCFVNLVDYDMLYGHRRDVEGYAKAMTEFDEWLGGFVDKMLDDDALIITADHGCDPSYTKTTDHTREYTPMILIGKKIKPVNLGTRSTFADIAATVADMLDVKIDTIGKSFLEEVL
ncbi:MAG: phosphopentomutase [Clostridia bacterium]|nr:phosphopentomutase [Clostridia bacterium]